MECSGIAFAKCLLFCSLLFAVGFERLLNCYLCCVELILLGFNSFVWIVFV